MQAKATTRSLLRHKRSKASIATLTALFALAAQALVPTPAAAEMAEGVCTNNRMILDGVEMSCLPIYVTGTAPGTAPRPALNLSSSPGRPIQTVDIPGEGLSSRSRGGQVTRRMRRVDPDAAKCALLRSTYEQGDPLPVDPVTEEVRFSVLAIGNREDDGTPLDFYSAPDWSNLPHLEKRLRELHKLARETKDDPDRMDDYQGQIRDVTRQLRREYDRAYMWVRALNENCAGAFPWPIPKDEDDD
jgi:hypothetical protein